jgi:RNA polymerase sigma factor (TIGR02999 family)
MPSPDAEPAVDVTRILNAIRAGEVRTNDELMAAVYAELRAIARGKLSRERRVHTLQATALVHEAWLRLGDHVFENRAHFFGAAAEVMRRILVDLARRRNCSKHGAQAEHRDFGELEIAAPVANQDELLAVNDALEALARHDPRKAELVKLRYFVGLSFEEAADVLGISVPTAKRDWAYSRVWLHHEIAAS